MRTMLKNAHGMRLFIIAFKFKNKIRVDHNSALMLVDRYMHMNAQALGLGRILRLVIIIVLLNILNILYLNELLIINLNLTL